MVTILRVETEVRRSVLIKVPHFRAHSLIENHLLDDYSGVLTPWLLLVTSCLLHFL